MMMKPTNKQCMMVTVACAAITTTATAFTCPNTSIIHARRQTTSIIISHDTLSSSSRRTPTHPTQLQLIQHPTAFLSSPLISTDIGSYFNLFEFSGNVPFVSSLVLNTILFFSLRPKLMTMLTPEGFAHSLALGTMLWTTLGWRGWTGVLLYIMCCVWISAVLSFICSECTSNTFLIKLYTQIYIQYVSCIYSWVSWSQKLDLMRRRH